MRARALIASAVALAVLGLGAAPASAGVFVSPTVGEIFTTGGESGAPFENDFVELKNTNATPLGLSGASVQYATATGTTWEVTSLSGFLLTDGYYLVQLDSNGTDGASLPTPDATGTSDLQLSGGKVALVNGTTALTGACPSGSGILDLVGWGDANCSEGEPLDSVVGVFYSLVRKDQGCTDSGNNLFDFFQTGPPTPKNTSSTTYSCANDPPVLDPIGPQTVDEGTELRIDPHALDADGDDLTYSASNLPPGASFDVESFRFTWTPTCSQAGTYPGVHFEARDPENASDSEDITITVDEACDPEPTTTTLKVAKKGKRKLLASGEVAPPQPGGEVDVTLLRKRHGNFKRKAEDTPTLKSGSAYEAKFKRPKKGRCRVVAEFPGNGNAESSRATKTFRCRRP